MRWPRIQLIYRVIAGRYHEGDIVTPSLGQAVPEILDCVDIFQASGGFVVVESSVVVALNI